MKKQLYTFTRRHDNHAAGQQIELTEDEAQRLDNEAPGVIVRMERPNPALERPAAAPAVEEPKKQDKA